MVNNDNDYQVPATLSQGNRPNQIKLTLDEEQKTEGPTLSSFRKA